MMDPPKTSPSKPPISVSEGTEAVDEKPLIDYSSIRGKVTNMNIPFKLSSEKS